MNDRNFSHKFSFCLCHLFGSHLRLLPNKTYCIGRVYDHKQDENENKACGWKRTSLGLVIRKRSTVWKQFHHEDGHLIKYGWRWTKKIEFTDDEVMVGKCWNGWTDSHYCSQVICSQVSNVSHTKAVNWIENDDTVGRTKWLDFRISKNCRRLQAWKSNSLIFSPNFSLLLHSFFFTRSAPPDSIHRFSIHKTNADRCKGMKGLCSVVWQFGGQISFQNMNGKTNPLFLADCRSDRVPSMQSARLHSGRAIFARWREIQTDGCVLNCGRIWVVHHPDCAAGSVFERRVFLNGCEYGVREPLESRFLVDFVDL